MSGTSGDLGTVCATRRRRTDDDRGEQGTGPPLHRGDLRAGRQEAVDGLVADDFVSHTWPSTGDGKADLKRATERVHAALADVRFTVDDLGAEGDRVAVRLTASAKQVGELMGRPASGRWYTIGEIHIFRISDGKMAEHWHQYDAMGMMRQLGASPGG